jgi:hypothetical protein
MARPRVVLVVVVVSTATAAVVAAACLPDESVGALLIVRPPRGCSFMSQLWGMLLHAMIN